MSYPYSFGSHPDFDNLKAMWDKVEQSYKQQCKSLEDQGNILKKDAEQKVKDLKSKLQWLYRIDNHSDNWMTIVKTCTSSDEDKKMVDLDSTVDKISRKFKIIENKYLIVGQLINGRCHNLPILNDENNGMILEDSIIHDIVELGKVPNDIRWNYKF